MTTSSLAELVGLTLLHMLWQAALVASLLLVALTVLRPIRARVRYACCVSALALLGVLPLITFAVLGLGAAPLPAHLPLLEGLPAAEPLSRRLAALAPLITPFWMLGVVFMQARLVLAVGAVHRLRTVGTRPLPVALGATVGDLARSLGLTRAVPVLLSARARVPMVVGWVRPVVLVPTEALARLAPAQLRAVLAHELAHVRRHDPLVNLVQMVLEALFFFHPCVWWISRRLRAEREDCCDDIAVEWCGDSLTYARALVTLDALASDGPMPALAATGGSLMHRVTRLLDHDTPSRPGPGWIVATLVLSVTLAGSSLAFAAGDDEACTFEVSATCESDLVEIVSAHDAHKGKVLAALRRGGVDDAALVDALVRLGADEELLAVLEAARQEVAGTFVVTTGWATTPPSGDHLVRQHDARGNLLIEELHGPELLPDVSKDCLDTFEVWVEEVPCEGLLPTACETMVFGEGECIDLVGAVECEGAWVAAEDCAEGGLVSAQVLAECLESPATGGLADLREMLDPETEAQLVELGYLDPVVEASDANGFLLELLPEGVTDHFVLETEAEDLFVEDVVPEAGTLRLVTGEVLLARVEEGEGLPEAVTATVELVEVEAEVETAEGAVIDAVVEAEVACEEAEVSPDGED